MSATFPTLLSTIALGLASLLLPPAPSQGTPPIVINEILAHTDDPDADAVELFNQSDSIVDLSDWLMTDKLTRPQTDWVRIPDGVTLAPGAYYVLSDCPESKPFAAPLTCSKWTFGLSEAGNAVNILQPDPAGGAATVIDRARFGASPNGVSFGRYVDSIGGVHYPLLQGVTLGAANRAPRIGPVVIEEIMYHPPPGYSEYVVIANTGPAPVALQDASNVANTWKVTSLDNGANNNIDLFSFPSGAILAPGERVVVAAVGAAQFRLERALPESVRVFGPMNDELSNKSAEVALMLPQPPELDGTVNYAMIDAVAYQDDLPWPPGADGRGLTLARIDSSAYGNDVINWQAAPPLAKVNSRVFLPAILVGQQ